MKNIQSQLNYLARNKIIGTVDGASLGHALVTQYNPLLESIFLLYVDQLDGDKEAAGKKLQKWLDDGHCYVFEIGSNCGDVFSANMVKSIEITDTGAIIKLKGK